MKKNLEPVCKQCNGLGFIQVDPNTRGGPACEACQHKTLVMQENGKVAVIDKNGRKIGEQG